MARAAGQSQTRICWAFPPVLLATRGAPAPRSPYPLPDTNNVALRARIAPGLVLPLHPNPPKPGVYRRGFSSWPELDASGRAPERPLGDGGCVEMLPVGLQP